MLVLVLVVKAVKWLVYLNHESKVDFLYIYDESGSLMCMALLFTFNWWHRDQV